MRDQDADEFYPDKEPAPRSDDYVFTCDLTDREICLLISATTFFNESGFLMLRGAADEAIHFEIIDLRKRLRSIRRGEEE